MKKILFLFVLLFCTTAIAHTVNWYVDNQIYQTTTCASGNDVTPPTPPTKYGYTFKWWYDANIIEGTWTQNGTPTPTNPIYPTFYQDGDLILRAVGSGNNLIADTYNPDTGQIIRRIGVKVLDGSETYSILSGMLRITVSLPVERQSGWQNRRICTHGIRGGASGSNGSVEIDTNYIWFGGEIVTNMGWTTAEQGKTWFADQYANGTPVTIYYPLATLIVENYTSSNP